MERTVVVVVVKTDKVFGWLGHMPILSWSLAQLREVRGIDAIRCVARPELVKRAEQLLVKEAIAVTPVPIAVLADDKALEQWLYASGYCADAGIVAVCRPTTPFLPAAKIETCIDLVRRKLADTAYTGQEVKAYTMQGRMSAYAELPGCRAFTKSAVTANTVRRFKHVPISLVEALDLGEPSNHRFAAALVANGTV